jgi:hypothetical protein
MSITRTFTLVHIRGRIYIRRAIASANKTRENIPAIMLSEGGHYQHKETAYQNRPAMGIRFSPSFNTCTQR